MPRAFGFAVYRSVGSHWERQPDAADLPPRPDGELIWVHVADPERFAALRDLMARLRTHREDVSIAVTFDEDYLRQESGDLPKMDADIIVGLRNAQTATARQFASHFRPDVCLWIGGMLFSVLIAEVARTGCLMLLADIDEADVQNVRRAWFPGRSTKTIDCFSAIYVRDAATSRAVRRHGVDHRKITVAGALQSGAIPPPVFDEQLSEMVEELAGRPVWLAVEALRNEIEPILLAHRNAIRLSHRLLLILVLSDGGDAELVRSGVEELGLRAADWDGGDLPEDTTQVIYTSARDELGLWYRIAPLTFLANSLSGPCDGIDPMPAAALGTALLKGPYVHAHIQSYARLAKAGAVETVRDAETLTHALVRLIAPDRAAAMALAGWEVATEGAELTDMLVDTVTEALDEREAAGARA